MLEGPEANDVIKIITDMSLIEPTQSSVNDIPVYSNFVEMHLNEMKRKLPTIGPKGEHAKLDSLSGMRT